MSQRLLDGLRVLDLSQLLPGPYATLLLADLGAEVIKVEARLGDLARQAPPFVRRRGAFYLALNRNKRSLGLNLKSSAGRALFLDLVRASDALVESYRPGRMARMGLGPETLRAANPGLVYCAISGFGQDGPDARRAGHDVTYQARAGLLDLSGEAEAPPIIPPLPIGDLAAGAHAAMGICAALVARSKTGQGATLDISILESLMAWMGPTIAIHRAGTRAERGRLGLAGHHPFYRVYATADGGAVALGLIEPLFWRSFCRAIDREDLVEHQFSDGAERGAVFAALGEIFASRSGAEWAALFQAHDLPAERVRDLDGALEDPQLLARGFFVVVDQPEEGPLLQAGCPVRVAAHAAGEPAAPAAARPAPDLGADTRSVLESVLGLGAGAIDALFAAGVVFAVDEEDRRRFAPDRLP